MTTAEITREEAEVAVAQLRLFISMYDDVDLPPGSRVAKHLEAARRAVAAYDAAETHLADNAA